MKGEREKHNSGRGRICIVTPGAIGSNPRVVKEADALYKAGFDVRVIATRTLEHIEPRDQALLARIDWPVERVDLRSRAGWRLRRIGQVLARYAFKLSGTAILADRALSPFTTALMPRALETASDLFIAHYPAALPVTAAAAKRAGATYAYDAEDFYLGDWPDTPKYDIERRLVREIEANYLPHAAYITAASPDIADAYVKAYRIKRPHVILNTFPRAQGPAAPTPRGIVKSGPSLYWFSQTIGPGRGLECAVRAIGAATTRPHLYLRGTLAKGFDARLDQIAEAYGARGRVHYLEPAAPDKMEQLAAEHDLGLVAETSETVSRRVCLTNKLFTYLLAGVPPLMTRTPAHDKFANEAGLLDLLYPIDDAAALARLIDNVLITPHRLADERARVWLLGQQRYNWDLESKRLLAVVAGSRPQATATKP